MSLRPSVIAFGVIETVFSLETLRGRFELVGLPGTALETWFAQTLRGAFALDATGAFVSFRDVATANLASMLLTGDEADSRIENVLAGFAELDDLDDALDPRFCDSCFRFRHNTLATGIQPSLDLEGIGARLEKHRERLWRAAVVELRRKMKTFVPSAEKTSARPQSDVLLAR